MLCCVKSCPALCDPMNCSPQAPLSIGILQARILEWVAVSFSRGSFPTQGSNPGLPHCRRIFYQLSHKWSLRILEWVAYLFSSGSSWPRNRTRVSCITGRFFTNWAIREAPYSYTCYTYVYKSFFTMLDKGLRKNNNKKKETEKLENKLNEIGTLNMK